MHLYICKISSIIVRFYYILDTHKTYLKSQNIVSDEYILKSLIKHLNMCWNLCWYFFNCKIEFIWASNVQLAIFIAWAKQFENT